MHNPVAVQLLQLRLVLTKMIGNTSSQHKEPDDSHLDFYVEQNNKKKGGEKTMDNNQQTSTVVQPSANPSTGFSATAPDPSGQIASQKFEVPVLQKAIDALEEAMQSLEDTYLEKSEYPNATRENAEPVVTNETGPKHGNATEMVTKKACTCPNCTDADCEGGMAKVDGEPDVSRANSVEVPAQIGQGGSDASPIVKAIQKAKDALDAVNAELVGKDKYENQNHSTKAPTKEDTVEIEKAAQCCDNACGNCTGPGCGCCEDCQKVTKAADAEPDADDDDLEKKDFSDAKRKQLAREGKAMPDGSYPIVTEQDLKNAIRSWGRGGAKPADKAHIIRRAKAIGKYDLIPDDWKNDMQKSVWGGSFFPAD